jgi:hypothetical protein
MFPIKLNPNSIHGPTSCQHQSLLKYLTGLCPKIFLILNPEKRIIVAYGFVGVAVGASPRLG